MYNFFCRNLRNYLKQIDNSIDYRSRISRIFEGLLDKDLYDKWQNEEPEKYRELSNIIFYMGVRQDEYVLFHTLVYDLWALEFNAVKDDAFDLETVEEQLKIVNLCVRGMYLEVE